MLRLFLFVFAFACVTLNVYGQETFPVNGVQDKRVGLHAIINATIYRDYQTRIDDAVLIIKDGKVLNVGSGLSIPQGAVIHDLDGKIIYPGLVDIFSDYGLPEVERRSFNFFATPQMTTDKEGAFAWNQTIRPETNASTEFTVQNSDAEGWRNQGFTSVLTHVKDGIARGSSALVTLADKPEQNVILKEKAAAHYSFDRGSSGQIYPTSIMGSAALLRQTYYDAQWYKSSSEVSLYNESIVAFNELQDLPQIFDASHVLNILLADKVGDEFGVQFIIKGNGKEYQRINEIKKTGASLIVPIKYPDAYDTTDPLEALDISYEQLKHWELADSNPTKLSDAGINFALTADGLNSSDFWKNLRRAVRQGLDESAALKALTFTPASMLNATNQVGSLNTGSIANFFVATDNIFNDGSTIIETWIQGERYPTKKANLKDFSGEYDLAVNQQLFKMEIRGRLGKQYTKIIINDSTKIKVDSKFVGDNITMMFTPEGEEKPYRLSGWRTGKNLKGNAQISDGTWVSWLAEYKGEFERKAPRSRKDSVAQEGEVIYPFVAYGNERLPEQRTYLIKNATVWTNEEDGVLTGTDVLVRDGKISQVGQGLTVAGATVIDGTGKHLTTGVIDEHSHVGLRGVNESSHAVTAEVRMYDAIDSEDIDIYRQLAGGVTAAQLLHGSANPIGGQSALVKFRWGHGPEGMRIAGADGYIKFALGENVKHGNRPRSHNIRYPQTRMGVEQTFVNAFTKARGYADKWKQYNELPSKTKSRTAPPRRDIQLDALVEILNSERFITCHSYVQSEINMLMKVAERFGFKVNTFTHILEGYKVADKMAKHGAGGSTFSDWWAYKWEVKEAIPYNPALMNMVGVVTAINSDNVEMARRLNQEAAKSVKYAGMTEEDAWKMVTLNPAKLLHLDDRMGSIKIGKDADLVLWSDSPLSIYAKVEQTMIDGAIYYDIDKDEEMRALIQADRVRIIAKMKKSDSRVSKAPRPGNNREGHCEDLTVSNNYEHYAHE